MYIILVSIGSLIMSNKQLIDLPDARQPRKGNKSDKQPPNIFYLCNWGPCPHPHLPLNSPLEPPTWGYQRRTFQVIEFVYIISAVCLLFAYLPSRFGGFQRRTCIYLSFRIFEALDERSCS